MSEIPAERDELTILREKLTESVKNAGKLVHERDRLLTKNEELRGVVALFQRTSKHLPIGGITCDEPDCEAAIGLVGVKMVDADLMDNAIEPVALALGWRVANGKHHCPEHTKKPTKKKA